MEESPVVPKLEILPANPLFLRMAGFQALIDGWFSAPADSDEPEPAPEKPKKGLTEQEFFAILRQKKAMAMGMPGNSQPNGTGQDAAQAKA
jgi:hypothetical protein